MGVFAYLRELKTWRRNYCVARVASWSSDVVCEWRRAILETRKCNSMCTNSCTHFAHSNARFLVITPQTADDNVWNADIVDTDTDVTDLFATMCAQMRVSALPLSAAAEFCRNLGGCTEEVLEDVLTDVAKYTNGKVITETDVIQMLKAGVLNPILYPGDDISPAMLRARMSSTFSSDDVSVFRGSVSGDATDFDRNKRRSISFPGAMRQASSGLGDPLSQSNGLGRTGSIQRNMSGGSVRRNGWRRFNSVMEKSSARQRSPQGSATTQSKSPRRKLGGRRQLSAADDVVVESRALTPLAEVPVRQSSAATDTAVSTARSSFASVADNGGGNTSVFTSDAPRDHMVDLSEIDVSDAKNRKEQVTSSTPFFVVYGSFESSLHPLFLSSSP